MHDASHILVGTGGEIVSVDRAFERMMREPAADLIGRDVIEMTAPGDRDECTAAIVELRQDKSPFVISKRFMRRDGSLVWVTNTVSIATAKDMPLIMATIVPIAKPARARDPGHMLDAARTMVSSRHSLHSMLGVSGVADASGDILVAAYIAEAEGRPFTLQQLAKLCGMPQSSARRWLDALLYKQLLQIELTTRADTPKSFVLSDDAFGLLEKSLMIEHC